MEIMFQNGVIMQNSKFLEKILDFIQKFQISKSTFGRMALKQPKFVFVLEAGRECRESTRARVLKFMREYAKKAAKKEQ